MIRGLSNTKSLIIEFLTFYNIWSRQKNLRDLPSSAVTVKLDLFVVCFDTKSESVKENPATFHATKC